MLNRLLTPAACLALAACATSPLDTTGVDNRVTPSRVVEDLPEYRGQQVQWGGHIVSIANKPDATRIEVLSYPASRDGYPNTYRDPTGRFVLRYEGFLEPRDFAPGRVVTAVGSVDSLITTSLGDSTFLVPVIRAEQLKLWDDQYGNRDSPRFGFGIGIGIGL